MCGMNKKKPYCSTLHAEAIEALELLVGAKDYKDLYGQCTLYNHVRNAGWKLARKVLADHNLMSTMED